MKKFLLITCALLIAACARFNSDDCYRMGTEQLELGNYSQAIADLEDAVRYEPSVARNHSNLGFAYLKAGNPDKFWYHTRQAVLCPDRDEAGPINFFQLCIQRIIIPGLCKKGTSYEKIVAALGTPDILIVSPEGSTSICQYGLFFMQFENGSLTSCECNIESLYPELSSAY